MIVFTLLTAFIEESKRFTLYANSTPSPVYLPFML
jgi:hypothetical protein